MRYIVASLIVSLVLVSGVDAQATETDISTTQDVNAQDLGVENPGFFSFFKRRVARIFTTNSVKRAKIDLEIANLLLLRARQAAAAGDTVRAQTLVDQYNDQIIALNSRIDTLVSQVSVTDPQVVALLDDIAQDNLLAASALNKLELKATGEFNKKLAKAKLDALKHIANVLDKENLTPEKLQEKLAKIADKLAAKETKAEKKFAKRIAAISEIEDNDAADSDDLDEAKDKALDDELAKIAKQNDKGIGDIVKEIEGSVAKHILVLQAVLAKVPDSAKPAIQAAIDRSIAKLQERALKDVNAINKALDDDDDDNLDEKDAILKKIEEKNKDEKIKKELERKKDKLKKHRERNGSGANSDGDKDVSESSGSTDVRRHDVRFREGTFEIDYSGDGTIKLNDEVRIRNDSDEAVVITSDFAGLNIGTLAKGAEKVVKLTKAGTFKVSLGSDASVSVTITVK